jgi:hypothetical protein
MTQRAPVPSQEKVGARACPWQCVTVGGSSEAVAVQRGRAP